jgi:hypothetical protein
LAESKGSVIWTNAKIIVFDAPQEVDKPYHGRLSTLTSSIPPDHPVLKVVNPTRCEGAAHLREFMKGICEDRPADSRGEGVVLRKPTAWYFEKDSFFSITVIYRSYVKTNNS